MDSQKQDGRGGVSLPDVVRALRALCLRAGRPSKPSEILFECLDEEEIRHDERFPDTYPIVVPGTICLFCLGNPTLTWTARTYSYARRSSLARHVQQHHLRYQRSDFLCPHPVCSRGRAFGSSTDSTSKTTHRPSTTCSIEGKCYVSGHESPSRRGRPCGRGLRERAFGEIGQQVFCAITGLGASSRSLYHYRLLGLHYVALG